MTDKLAAMSTEPARNAAVRELEGTIADLAAAFRRMLAAAAESVSPGMLPGTFKVLSAVSRAETITLSALAERLAADKGQVSRSVTELETLGLVERTADADDRRIKLIAVTPEGRTRLDAARQPLDGRLDEVMQDWPLESIEQLTLLLRAFAAGQAPVS